MYWLRWWKCLRITTKQREDSVDGLAFVQRRLFSLCKPKGWKQQTRRLLFLTKTQILICFFASLLRICISYFKSISSDIWSAVCNEIDRNVSSPTENNSACTFKQNSHHSQLITGRAQHLVWRELQEKLGSESTWCLRTETQSRWRRRAFGCFVPLTRTELILRVMKMFFSEDSSGVSVVLLTVFLLLLKLL